MTANNATNTTNLSRHFKYDMGDPQNTVELMSRSNAMMDGGLAFGMMGVLWALIVFGLTRQGWDGLSAMIAANTASMFGSFILFLGGFMDPGVPTLFALVFSISVVYSYMTR